MDKEKIEKFDIKLKSTPKDGVILQLHHTVRTPTGESRRIRFCVGAFHEASDKMACTDSGGNLFVLDLADQKFWKLTHTGPCSAMHFSPHHTDSLLVATTKNIQISFIDIETGESSITLSGHSCPVKHVSFSSCKFGNLLTASQAEAILWEMRNYTKYFTLNTYPGAQIQQIMFTPGCDYLVAAFQNDTIQIWKHEGMKSVKQIIPNNLKHMKSIAFTTNGRAMAMAGLSPILILFSMDTWKAIKSYDLNKFNISGVQDIAFIPQACDGGANKILAMLTSDCSLHLFDIGAEAIIHKISPESAGIRKLVVSPTGKYFLCILQLGEVNIYNSTYIMDMAQNAAGDKPCSSNGQHLTPKGNVTPQKEKPLKAEIEQRMRVCMDSARLRRILMQYGEYPEKFRSIIWRSLLNTPRNKVAYSALIDKGIYFAYKDIERQFSIHSLVTLKNLKRLLSCLAHWCPLFGVTTFLPGFVFPFVKVLQKDPLLLYECVATILVNYCQLWFEYAPFPPISVLSMVENILAEHDHQLLDHFCDMGVTSQTYALKILETAFSEVLSCSEWLILWDHILSNEPAFILMAVASYNIIQRNVLRKLRNHDDFETFYHMQNPIDKKHFLKKTYILLNETPKEIHPRKFFNSFTSLEGGSCYQQFFGYPKATICMKLAKKQKKSHSDKFTLKQLTALSQQRQIKERLQAEESNEKKNKAKNKKHRKCSNANADNPVCKPSKHNIGSDAGNKNESSMEKEVEKLITRCSQSDMSEF